MAERIAVDLLVIGGGVAGTCAAIAGARQGLSTALVGDRPVLGGNASSEIRVWVNGATGGRNNRYAREGGIMEELLLENRYRNTDGNAHLWDAVVLDAAKAEPNLRLFLNTVAQGCRMEGRRIAAVLARQLMSERELEFAPTYVVDASGDGAVAAQGGARFRKGREHAAEYNETWAPPEADARTLGNSLMFYTRDAGRPIRFVPPTFAHDYKQSPPPRLGRANAKETRCLWWWIEYGGELDTIAEADTIRDELLAIVYGAWDYVKNSGRYPEAQTLQLEWIGSLPGKRESRRFVGDHVLTEGDLTGQAAFPDAVGHGGWSIDLHPPAGFYDPVQEGSAHWHLPGPYSVPFRSLYSSDVDNLLLAGRLMSASHVAFGSARVQATLATTGQAVGTAAAVGLRHGGAMPREIARAHIGALQQALLREDQWVIGVRAADPADLAPSARVAASSVAAPASEEAQGHLALDQERWLRLPAAGEIEAVEVLGGAEAPTDLEVQVWAADRGQNYLPFEQVGTVTVTVPAGGPHWVRVPVGRAPDASGGLLLRLGAAPGVRLAAARRRVVGAFTYRLGGDPKRGGGMSVDRGLTPCFRVHCAQPVFAAANVVNGFARPYAGVNCWRSADGLPQWLDLQWDAPVQARQVQITFDSDLDEHYLNLVDWHSPSPAEMVRAYRVLVRGRGGEWCEVAAVGDNRQRLCRHRFPEPVECQALRLEVLATAGAPAASVFEVRVY